MWPKIGNGGHEKLFYESANFSAHSAIENFLDLLVRKSQIRQFLWLTLKIFTIKTEDETPLWKS